MKPFNLEEAKAGKPVCTRDGRKARIICFDRINGECKIISLIFDTRTDFEAITNHYLTGNIFHHVESDSDLFMITEKKKLWIGMNRDKSIIDGCFHYSYHTTRAFENFHELNIYIGCSNFKDYKIIEIEIEV